MADVVRLARTSRRTFYEHFGDLDECFLALFEQVTDRTLARIAAAVDPDGIWEDQIDHALDAYINGVSAQPELQQSFVRELPGLGPAAAERQRQVIEHFADLITQLVAAGRARQPAVGLAPLDRDTAIIVVGGLRELLVMAIQDGRDLQQLRPSATRLLTAVIGPERSAAATTH